MILPAIFAAIAATALVLWLNRYAGKGGVLDLRKNLKQRLSSPESLAGDAAQAGGITKKYNLSEIETFRSLLGKYDLAKEIAVTLKILKWRISASAVLLFCLLLGVTIFMCLRPRMAFLLDLGVSAGAAFLPILYLRALHRRYIQQFTDRLPDALAIISSSIKAGHGLEMALNVVSKSAPHPANHEFRLMMDEVNLGLPLQTALKNLNQRLSSQELKIFATGISIHQELGGNLSEILDNLEKTMRERFALKREIKSLAAQGVISARVLFCIPVAVAVIWATHDPQMFFGFLTSPVGRQGMIVSAVLQILGFFLIRRVINLKD